MNRLERKAIDFQRKGPKAQGHVACTSRRYFVAGLVVLLLTATSVARAEDQANKVSSTPVIQTTDKDGIRFTVEADRATAQVADPITVRFHVEAPAGAMVTFSPAEKTLGSLTVRETRDAFDVPSNQGRTWTRTQVVESLAAGAVEVPAVTVAYKQKVDGVEQTGEIASPALAIEVTSILPADADPLKFRDIKGEVTIAPPQTTPIWWWYVGGAAAAATACGVWWYRRRRRPLTAAERALAELARLDIDEYLRGSLVQDLYVAMTGIVRHYIERRFALHAPRQTTPEFLAGLCGEASFALEHKRLLEEFLEAADLVKFARFSPAADDVYAARAAAERFIRGTDEPVAKDKHEKHPTAPASAKSSEHEPGETCEVTR